MKITDLTVGVFAVTPEGAAQAYKELNAVMYKKYGNYNNSNILMYMQPLIHHVQNFGNEEKWVRLIQDGFDKLIQGGAQMIWMPANSSHLAVHHVNTRGVPFFNMVDASVTSILHSKDKPLVLGTTISVSEKLYLRDKRMLDHCVRPDTEEQNKINGIIINELVLGKISTDNRQFFKDLVKKYQVSRNITSVFFACTELPCFFDESDFDLPIGDCIKISAESILSSLDQLMQDTTELQQHYMRNPV